VPLYCEALVEERIRQCFSYAFSTRSQRTRALYRSWSSIASGWRLSDCWGHADADPAEARATLRCAGVSRRERCLLHRHQRDSPESWPLLEGLDVLILDALRKRPHATHFSLEEAVEVARKVRPRRTLLTHISTSSTTPKTNASLPAPVSNCFRRPTVPLS